MVLVVGAGGMTGVRSVQIPAPWIDPALARELHIALVRDPDLRCPSAGDLALSLEMAVGFDAARAHVDGSRIALVSETMRRHIAPRARLASSWDELLRRAPLVVLFGAMEPR
jgi:hypothetical protein